jgi:ribose-phosphate pyrophosphokinase
VTDDYHERADLMTLTEVPRQKPDPGQGKSQRMTNIDAENRKSLMLFTGRAFPELAEEIGGVLGVRPTPMDAYDFANGEIFVRYRDSVRGSDAFVVESMSHPLNKWMMESLIMVDALKRGSAKRITIVVPFYPYSRQDKKHRGREPISARLMADLYKTAGADRILTVDLHTAQIQGFFDGPVDHLFAMNLLAEYVENKWGSRPITVVAPDSGRVRVAERWTDRLGGCPLAFIHKTRDPQKPNQIVANRVVGEVEGRVCLIVDDMIDTGGTITRASEILFDEGAADVIVAATHPILSDPATERLRNSKISEVVVTNTLPLPAQKHLDKITVLSIAPLLARAIREVFDDGSVTTLFGGLS